MICHWTLEIICFEMQMDRLDKSESFLACHINYLIIWPLIHHPFFTGKVYKVAFFLFQLQLFSHLWDLSVVPEPGGPGGPLAPPIFCRSVNPIRTREGRLSPPITTGLPNVFHLPASLHLDRVFGQKFTRNAKNWFECLNLI